MRAETIYKLYCPFDKENQELKVINRGLNNDIPEGVLTWKPELLGQTTNRFRLPDGKE